MLRRLLHELKPPSPSSASSGGYTHDAAIESLRPAPTSNDPGSDANLTNNSSKPDDDGEDLTHLHAVLLGLNLPYGYAGGRWLLDIRVPEDYPLKPPHVRFVTRACHPNVDRRTGEICLDLLKTGWSAAYTIRQVLTAIWHLLGDAAPESPLNIDVAQLWRAGDMVAVEALTGYYTRTERYEGP